MSKKRVTYDGEEDVVIESDTEDVTLVEIAAHPWEGHGVWFEPCWYKMVNGKLRKTDCMHLSHEPRHYATKEEFAMLEAEK